MDTGRRFSAEAKRQIVEERYIAGDSVSCVARRHGLFPAQLFAWRRAARECGADDWRREDGERRSCSADCRRGRRHAPRAGGESEMSHCSIFRRTRTASHRLGFVDKGQP
ncbi:transposase (plasmid) [Mesorhizobium sp. AR07]|uniref:transposase n=1 Tax=Mesorhizobium sp. AR07 TaxID=2865838 RepID=UPI0021FA6D4C|nr:transposase [Mesorhizobium sp. AR07]